MKLSRKAQSLVMLGVLTGGPLSAQVLHTVTGAAPKGSATPSSQQVKAPPPATDFAAIVNQAKSYVPPVPAPINSVTFPSIAAAAAAAGPALQQVGVQLHNFDALARKSLQSGDPRDQLQRNVVLSEAVKQLDAGVDAFVGLNVVTGAAGNFADKQESRNGASPYLLGDRKSRPEYRETLAGGQPNPDFYSEQSLKARYLDARQRANTVFGHFQTVADQAAREKPEEFKQAVGNLGVVAWRTEVATSAFMGGFKGVMDAREANPTQGMLAPPPRTFPRSGIKVGS